MKSIKLTSKKVGENYLKIIKEIALYRELGKLRYDDMFLEESIDSLLFIINKKNKSINFLISEKIKDKEELKDLIIDLINYYIFILMKEKK